VVAYKSEKKNNKQFIHIADPAYGKLKLQQKETESLWNVDHEKKGITLLFEAHTNFNPHMDSEVKKINFRISCSTSNPCMENWRLYSH
jgi:hypothetical protein